MASAEQLLEVVIRQQFLHFLVDEFTTVVGLKDHFVGLKVHTKVLKVLYPPFKSGKYGFTGFANGWVAPHIFAHHIDEVDQVPNLVVAAGQMC